MKILDSIEGNTPTDTAKAEQLSRIILGWLLLFVATYIAGLISLVYVVVSGLRRAFGA
jgi:hypothetical protein